MDTALLQRRYRFVGENAPLFYDTPLHFVRGEGVWLYAEDGTRYLDVYNNVPHVGHCHPHVVKALCDQANTLNVHTRYLHQGLVDYSERLASTMDNSDEWMVALTCTGSEANDMAMRMARMLSGNQGLICSNFGYHGNTEQVWEIATAFRDGAVYSDRIRAINPPCSYRTPYEEEGEALADRYLEEIDRAITEFEQAGLGCAGMLFCSTFVAEGLPKLPPTFMQKAVERIHQAGGFFISDEVQGGFGRTGHAMWGHENYGVVADIVTLGKPMGNGHPLAGMIARADLMRAFRDRELYFNTFGGNPVSCAVGMAVLDVIEQEDLLAHAIKMQSYVESKLHALQEKYELIGDVRCFGQFYSCEFVEDRATKEPASAKTKQIVNTMKDRHVLISRTGPKDNVLKMRPPMPFAEEHADILIGELDDVIGTIA